MSKWLNSLQPFGALLLRLVLGASMAFHGYQKVVPHGALHHYAYSTIPALGLPYWLGYVSALTEFLGGTFLLLGLLTRFFAFLIAINMAVAILFVTCHRGYIGSEYVLALLAIALMVLFYGAGALGLDRKFGLS